MKHFGILLWLTTNSYLWNTYFLSGISLWCDLIVLKCILYIHYVTLLKCRYKIYFKWFIKFKFHTMWKWYDDHVIIVFIIIWFVVKHLRETYLLKRCMGRIIYVYICLWHRWFLWHGLFHMRCKIQYSRFFLPCS